MIDNLFYFCLFKQIPLITSVILFLFKKIWDIKSFLM
nr:MAG TPA: hypothetical protein [Crassvirales sp.]